MLRGELPPEGELGEGSGWSSAVTLGHLRPTSVHFVYFVTLRQFQGRGLARPEGGRPGARKGRIALPQRVSGLAAHPRLARSEGDRTCRGEGDNEGDSPRWVPFVRAAAAARSGEQVQAGAPFKQVVGWHNASTGEVL